MRYKILEIIKNNFKSYYMDLLILILLLILVFFNLISGVRLKTFLIILCIIFIYKFIYKILDISNLEIKNKKLIKFLIYFNKYKNPFLPLLILIEENIFNLLCKNKSNILIYIIFIIFILLINPLKILLFKFYKLLVMYRMSQYYKIILSRILGLILSVLIFTHIIFFIKDTLGLNIFWILYLYLLIVAIFSEYRKMENNKNKFLDLFLCLDRSTICLLNMKLNWNLISIILDYNNIKKYEEIIYYVDSVQISKIEKFKISYTWDALNNCSSFIDKPSYLLYQRLIFLFDYYFVTIDDIIIFKINNWNILELYDWELNGKKGSDQDPNDFIKLKMVYNYDFEIFKIFLFLYWDMEEYLGSDVRNTLKIDQFGDYYILKFSMDITRAISYEKYNERIKGIKKDLWFNFKILGLLNKYNLNLHSIIEKKPNNLLLKYKRINEMLPDWVFSFLKLNTMEAKDYERFLDLWYQEWKAIPKEKKKEFFFVNLKQLDTLLVQINDLNI
jgi:hypothetical protein